MNVLKAMILGLCLFSAAGAQPQGPDVLWMRVYRVAELHIWANDAVQTPDGGFVMCGTSATMGTSVIYSGLVLRVYTLGDTLWMRSFTYGDYGFDFYGVASAPEGGYIVAGRMSNDSASSLPGIMKLDDQGNCVWTRFCQPQGIGIRGGFRSITALSNGYAMCGGIGGVHWPCVFVARTDGNGDTLWTRTICSSDWPISDIAYDIQETQDGGFIVAGKITELIPNTRDQFYLIRLNDQGDTLWTRIYGEDEFTERAYSVCQTSDGGFMAVGEKGPFPGGSVGTRLLRLDANGDLLWERSAVAARYWVGYNIAHTNDGSVVIVTYSEPDDNPHSDIVLTKLTESGDTLWSAVYPTDVFTQPSCLLQTSDGGYFVAGSQADLSSNPTRAFALRLDQEAGTENRPENPRDESLLYAYPNPFNTTTTFSFALPHPSPVTLSVFNTLGQRVRDVSLGLLAPGEHRYLFDAGDLPSGLYLARIEAVGTTRTRKVVLIR